MTLTARLCRLLPKGRKSIKAQIIKHYQHLADREAFVTALAFVDVKNLTTDDIVDINGDKWIVSHRRI